MVDLHALTHQIEYIIRPREYGLIILDAFYRFMPPKTVENDSGQIAELYNRHDNYKSITIPPRRDHDIIATPKEGKSFLITDLAFAVIQGAKWLGRLRRAA